MTLDKAILAIIAPRYPGTQPLKTIRKLVNDSAALDDTVGEEETLGTLNRLAKRNLAAVQVDELDGEARWGSTAAGKERWILDGQYRLG